MIKQEKLDSRYANVNTLAYLYDNNTAIVTSTGEYTRYILSKDDKTIDSIDFEGGPMISIGSTLFDKKIKSIKHAYVIELE